MFTPSGVFLLKVKKNGNTYEISCKKQFRRVGLRNFLYDMYGAYIDSGQGKFKIELLTVQRLASYDTEGNEVYKSVRLWK